MHKIDSVTAKNGSFVDGNPATGTKATRFTADWCNAVQEEIANVITGAGNSLNKNTNSQLVGSVKKIAKSYTAPVVYNYSAASATAKRDSGATVSGSNVIVNYGAVMDASVCFNVTASLDCYLNVTYFYNSINTTTQKSGSIVRKVRVNSGTNFVCVRFAFYSNDLTFGDGANGHVQVNIASGTGVDASTSVTLSDIVFDAVVINGKS